MLKFRNSSLTPRHVLALAASLALATLASVVVMAAGSPTQAFACKHVHTPAKALKDSTARDAMRCLFNGARKHHGVRKLRPNKHLAKAAQKHTDWMRNASCLSHQCPGEPALGSRLASAGYFRGAKTYGFSENIIYTQTHNATTRNIFKGWMHSAGHRANILSGSMKDVGIGVSAKRKSSMWTADFAYRR